MGAVSSSGVFSPVATGTATITAKSTQDSAKSGSATVTVTVPPTITSVSVVCSPASILTTQTSNCSATVQGTGAFSSAVTWAATDGTITSSGVFTPVASGTATVTAISTQDTTKSGTTSIAVLVPGNPVPTVTMLSPNSLAVGTAPQSILIHGTGFLPSSTVTFNGLAHTAAYVSASQLTIALTISDLSTVGSFPIVVTNPSPGGGAFSPVNFTVTSNSSANDEWTWMSGSSTRGATGVYGSLGVPSASNIPGERVGAVTWIDSHGNLWLFGGYGVNLSGIGGYLNDLWEYSPTDKTWTWVSGSNTPNQAGVYGTQGASASANVPGSRESAVGWTDSKGNLWLFGGGTNSSGNSAHFNDLWEFDPAAKTWTWITGSNTPNQAGVYGTQGVSASTNVPCARDSSVTWIDSNGNLWLFGGYGVDSTGKAGYSNELWEFNPSAKTWAWVSGANTANYQGVYGTQGVPASTNAPGARYQAVGWIDGNGDLWLFGGYGVDSAGNNGYFNDLWEYNPTGKTWNWVNGGNTANQAGVYGTQGTPSTTNVPGARYSALSWIDSNGNFWLFGGGADTVQNAVFFNDLWEYNPTAKTWTWETGANTPNQPGVYGMQGIPAGTNVPGAREFTASWIDGNGNFWLFGGDGVDSAGLEWELNDLWLYQPSNTPIPTIASVSVACSPSSILTTQTSVCTPTVTGTGNFISSVTWSVSPNGIGAINSAGLFTPTGAGTATITATSSQDTTKSGLAAITVTVPSTITTVSIVCSPTSILTTQTSTCTPTVSGTGSYSSSVNWSVSPSGIGAVSSSGVFTPAAPGTATITAVSTQDSTKSGNAIVTVTIPPTITSVSVACSPTSILTTQSSACIPTVNGTGNFSNSVSWSISPSTIGSVSSSGVFTPASVGTAAITATSIQDSAEFGTATVSVSAPPTITSISVICSDLTVPVSKTSQCNATVQGTGSFSSNVLWTVNGTPGGSTSFGTISSGGLYQAPTITPAAYIVTIAGVSAQDPTKSASVSILVAGTITSATQTIAASTGGTISLSGGNSATIPAGVLTADSVVTLQLISTPTQPTNKLFGGIGPSLLMSFSPVVGTSAVHQMFDPNVLKPNATTGTSNITFMLQGGQGLSSAQLQNALGVLDVNDGTNNYFSIPSTYDATANRTTLLVDPSMIEPSSTLEIGLAIAQQNGQNQGSNLSLLKWDDSIPAFINTPANYCPSGSRTLVLIHGIFSTVQESFGQAGGAATCSLASGISSCPVGRGPYDTVLGINYNWSDDIGVSAQIVANILNSFFAPPCSYTGSIDIEAHSQGTLVTLTSAGTLSPSARAKLAHVVLVAGPIDGTPLASDANLFLTNYFNLLQADSATIVEPSLADNPLQTILPELMPNSKSVQAAQADAAQNLKLTEIIAVGGDAGFLSWWGTWLQNLLIFSGKPNDGVVLVSSSLPTDSTLPNLVRLVGNDPSSGNYPYPYNHTSLVDNPKVMPDILNALDGAGETGQVSLNITPASVTLSPGQVITLTANVANMLNPQLQWSVSGGSAPGTLNSVTGTSVQYTAPISPGGPFKISATIAAVALSNSVSISVEPTSNPVPAISSPLVPASLPVGSAVQTLIINGTGFLTSSTVLFNGNSHTPVFKSATQLTIQLTSADLATPGSFPVVVTNPAPGGGSSAAAIFIVINPQTSNNWTWVSGSKLANGVGAWGTEGIASSANVPSARGSASSWTDSSGNLWLFGGWGLDSSGNYWGTLNDLWEFNSSGNTWAWVNGSNSANVAGVYGVQGVASSTNVPSARGSSVSWIDSSGNLWLFGGSNGIGTPSNDLWEFNPANKTWMWVNGANSGTQPGAYGAIGVPSSSNVPGSRSNAISWIDSSGNLWMFGGIGYDSAGNTGYLNDLWEFNPSANQWGWVSGSNTLILFSNGLRGEPGTYGTLGTQGTGNVPCGRQLAVSWIDSSGNLWLFGGYGINSTTVGAGVLNDLWEFNPTSKQWTWVGGANTENQSGVYGALGAAGATNVPGARQRAVSWTDRSGNFWLFGGIGYDSVGYYQYLNDLWEYNPTQKMWTWISGSNKTGAIGVWGTPGVAASANVPGARDQGVSWIDNNGFLWTFGGYGSDSVGNGGYLNDLWRYQPLNLTAPSISGVSPTTFVGLLFGGTITINGSNFQSGATLTFAPPVGSPIQSTPGNLTYISSKQLSYKFSDSAFLGGANGTWTVTVTNSNGQSSNTWNFNLVCSTCEINP